jgi:hypothetical protein
LDFRGDLVCTIVPVGQIFRADISQCVGSSRCLVLVFRRSFGKGIIH